MTRPELFKAKIYNGIQTYDCDECTCKARIRDCNDVALLREVFEAQEGMQKSVRQAAGAKLRRLERGSL